MGVGLSGCFFDDALLRSRFSPATLAVANTTSSAIVVTAIYSVPEVEGAFVLDEMKLAAGETETVRITEPTYDALVAGSFVVEGRCGRGAPDWRTSGRDLQREGVRNATEWKVSITLAGCPPAP